MAVMESKFDTYTSEDLTRYQLRLHINTVICLFFNTLAIYCILFHSTKNMEVYKWYLLSIQLAAALFDFHLTFIATPFPTFPIPGFCAAGIWSRHWGYIWGQLIQFAFVHWFLCFQGMAIIYGMIYRYRVISEKMEWMDTIWARTLMVIVPLTYPIPAVTLLLTTEAAAHCPMSPMHDSIYHNYNPNSHIVHDSTLQCPKNEVTMAVVGSSYDSYTADDLTYHEIRLHINTAICAFFNALAIYCILFHSTKNMEVYKWYLLVIQLTTALFDFHLTFIAAPFPTFPIPGFCAAGIWSRHWGYIWGQMMQFTFVHWFLCFQGMAIIYGIMYRYQVISEKMEWMNTIWARILMVIVPLIYPIPAATLLMKSIPERNITLKFVSEEAPEMLQLYLTEPCNSITHSTTAMMYYFTAAAQILIGFGIILFFSYKTYDELMKKKQFLSEASFRLQKQLLIALCLQCAIPFTVIIVPVLTLYMMVFFKVQKMKSASIICLQIITVHSSVNGLLQIMTIKPYRQAIINLFCCKNKSTIDTSAQRIHTVSNPRGSGIENPKDDPDLGPNVISIKPPPKFGFLGSTLIRLALGILILGAGVAAVYYSIQIHSDSKDKKELAKTFFTLNRTQYCFQGGIYTRETNNGTDSLTGKHIHFTEKMKSLWVQDHENKKLYYTHGDPNETESTSFYVYNDFTLTVKGNTCVKSFIGYDQFLANLGVSGLLYIRTEEIIRDNEPEDAKSEEESEYVEINFFQGEPIIPGTNETDTKYPFLGFGYMDLSNSVSYAWQIYYQDIIENPIYFEEYWYPYMTSGPTNASYLAIPAVCLPQIS
ncbi:hypothetical protein FO519_001621 [Halicephalobus sp. NKZ332]|nr:hypothetical protein FO519_001621 [Halicephalobus sp. NKZ332]